MTGERGEANIEIVYWALKTYQRKKTFLIHIINHQFQ